MKPEKNPRNTKPKELPATPAEVVRKRKGPQCTATSTTTGARCRNAPIKGGTTCKFHGGGAPQVRAKATQRLMAMVMPALVELNKILRKKGTSDADRLKAIREVLSRTGFSETQILALTPTEDPWAQILAAQLEGDDPEAQAARNRIARMKGDHKPAIEAGHDSRELDESVYFDELNIETLRSANRDDLDNASTISNDGHEVVRGEVIEPNGKRTRPTTNVTDDRGDYSPVNRRTRKQDDAPTELDPTPPRMPNAKTKSRRERYLDALGETDDDNNARKRYGAGRRPGD